MQSVILIVDVAHPPLHPDDVEAELIRAWSQVRNSPSLRILKIIHGKGGATKNVVRNWVFRNRNKFKETLDGENYSLYDASTQEMRKHVGNYSDADLDARNPGITIVWMK